MRAGHLRHRIVVERSDATAQDSLGGIQPTWTTHKRLWAKVEELNGRELEFARQKVPNSTHRVTIRFTQNVAADMRVRHQNRILNIENIEDENDIHEMLVLTCSETK